jgi:hypothetical protein
MRWPLPSLMAPREPFPFLALPEWRCDGGFADVSSQHPPLASAVSGETPRWRVERHQTQERKVRTPGICESSASRHLHRMTCGGRRQRCAAISVYRNRPYRSVSTIRPARRRRPAVAGDHQQGSHLSFVGRVDRKRKVLDAWAVELRRMVGGVPVEAIGLLAA